MTENRLVMSRCRCPLCRGTGASSPDAGDGTDWRDYLPCVSCRGTGHVLVPVPAVEPATCR